MQDDPDIRPFVDTDAALPLLGQEASAMGWI